MLLAEMKLWADGLAVCSCATGAAALKFQLSKSTPVPEYRIFSRGRRGRFFAYARSVDSQTVSR